MDHPLVRVRDREPYVIGTGLPVWEVVEVVSATGSVAQAAAALGLSTTVVQAAVDFAGEHSADAPDTSRVVDKARGSLERLAQIAGLFTGVAAIVYIAGGVVLATRLYFARVNSGAVLGQLPREFLVTIGVGQVLLPILVFAGLYRGLRLLRGDSARVPRTRRWADPQRRVADRVRFAVASLLLAVAIVAPGAIFASLTDHERNREFSWLGIGLAEFRWLGIGLAGAVVLAPIGVAVRARVTERAIGGAAKAEAKAKAWSEPRPVWQMTALWAALLAPAAIISWPFAPFQEAKVCTTSGFEEHGYLIGQTSNGVFLAESPFRDEPRRVATFTATQTEEVFIGPWAGGARCDPSGLRGAALASTGAGDASASLIAATRLRAQAQSHSGLQALDDLAKLRYLLLDIVTSVRDVKLAADRTVPGVARPISDSAKLAEDAAERIAAPHEPDGAGRRWDRLVGVVGPSADRVLSERRRSADRALAAARTAVQAAVSGEKAVVSHVRAGANGS